MKICAQAFDVVVNKPQPKISASGGEERVIKYENGSIYSFNYRTGELLFTNVSKENYSFSDYIKETRFHIGGDNLTLNPAFFKGEYRELALYSDLRTASEIMSDYQELNR